MSTILKALRRLEDDAPRKKGGAAEPPREGEPSSSQAPARFEPATSPGPASADSLRGRILAEEAAASIARPDPRPDSRPIPDLPRDRASRRDPGPAATDRHTPSDSDRSPNALRSTPRRAGVLLVLAALVAVLLLGVFFAPIDLLTASGTADTPTPPLSVASSPADPASVSAAAATAPTPAPAEDPSALPKRAMVAVPSPLASGPADVPDAQPAPLEPSTPPASARPATPNDVRPPTQSAQSAAPPQPTPSAVMAAAPQPIPSAAPTASAKSNQALTSDTAAPSIASDTSVTSTEPRSSRRSEAVAVESLPVALADPIQPAESVAPAAEGAPAEPRVPEAPPIRASRPATPEPAPTKVAALPAPAAPRPESSASSAPSSAAPDVKRLLPVKGSDVTVVRTAWHPKPERRSARIRLHETGEVVSVHEGDAVAGLVLREITPSSVVFDAAGVEIRRRVGDSAAAR